MEAMIEANELLSSQDHALRRALVDELHLRRFPSFAAPMRMTQLVMFTGEAHGPEVRQHAEELCRHLGAPAPVKGRYFCVESSGGYFVWEQHTEFCTYSFVHVGAFSDPFDGSLLTALPREWIRTLPGRTIRATQIALLSKDCHEPSPEVLGSYFSIQDLVCCDVMGGEARIWSNFRVHHDGLGRLLIRDQGLRSAGDTSRLVQRLQELGNYRNMALLGLPVVQELAPSLLALEQSLAEFVREIASGAENDELWLRDLSNLSAMLAKVTTETRYRIGATRAYAQLVEDRLESVGERRVPGHQTLADFTERRLLPAVRTCESFSLRLEDLSERAHRASALLRTRVETSLESQTRDLLDSMNRRTQLQMRLQQTLEGATALAISYYTIGIIGYIVKPLGHWIDGSDASIVLAALAPLIVLVSWRQLRRLRTRAHATTPEASKE